MWSRLRRAGRLSLAGQFLLLQLAVLVVVVAVASVVSVRQSEADFRDTRGARLSATAESLASTDAVREAMEQRDNRAAIAFYAQQRADDVGASAVYVTDPDGVVVFGTDPNRTGESVDLGSGDALETRSWTGDITDRGRTAIAATVPILSDNDDEEGGPPAGTLVGIVVVTEDYPPLTERLGRTFDDLVLFLGIGLVLGVAGSLLLSRLIRRRTRGLEPAEIAALADQREALLTSIREGLVAVGPDGRILLASDSARDLLDLPADSHGRPVTDLSLPPRVVELLVGAEEVRDAPLVVGGRVLVLNRNQVVQDGRVIGTVTTLRDRTELLALQSQLSARESVTETLRAQTHEFSNQLHTLSGLLQLGEYDDAAQVIGTLSRRRAEISDAVLARVQDPAVAALLVAKVSLAAERNVELVLHDGTVLPRLDPDLSADVGSVVGNLVDNAVEAVVSARPVRGAGGRVEVRLGRDGDAVVVQVADSGPGVPADKVEEIFRRGFSTKPSDASGRGVGLALVQVVCERRGGSVSVHNDGGAVFTARLREVARWRS
ncbi:ATPase [Nocardioides szechwanensis]|uniref:histidine kinase n=1 Tax=Nocardioides szechwanensis TaxID=1005944 RepID=A0A1H0H5M7_9ACTN|nr:ATP-binding protein [Nocardioides szechwanensis]GEP34185.1 ATPase [Nocardioides szechwanensis]SDO14390.1 signal transduction histidine kinase regulating citrate/malate metabolism [Nocardioides szechwanensis]